MSFHSPVPVRRWRGKILLVIPANCCFSDCLVSFNEPPSPSTTSAKRLQFFYSVQSSTTTKFSPVIVSLAILFGGASALAPSKVPQATKPAFDVQRVALNGLAAASLASALVVGPMADAVDMMAETPSFGSSSLVAERVTREGLYKEYDVDLGDQQYDDARSTYKSAKETKTKKGRRFYIM